MDTKKEQISEAHEKHAQNYQNRIMEEIAGKPSLARMCPFCKHKVETLYKGEHGYSEKPCPNCGRIVYFSPVKFRRR